MVPPTLQSLPLELKLKIASFVYANFDKPERECGYYYPDLRALYSVNLEWHNLLAPAMWTVSASVT